MQGTVIIAESRSKTVAATIEDLVREHAKTVFRVGYSVLRNHADAEDVAQETFMKALRHGRIDDIDNHKAWLVKIAWRLALDRAKRRAPEPIEELIENLRSPVELPDQAVSDRERGELMRRLMMSLPADLREVVVLSAVEEMTSADVASAMGIPEGTVRSKLMRARQRMKEKLAAMLEKK